MANRRLNQFALTFEPATTKIYGRVNIGTTGAPTLAVSSSGMTLNRGIQSIVRNSAGNYTVTLMDSYFRFLDASFRFISGASAPAAPSSTIVSEAVATLAAPTVIVQFRSTGGSPTDPASGEIMLFEITVKNSSA